MLDEKLKLFLIFQTISLPNVENFGHQEGHRLNFKVRVIENH
jgi:hypothetical protein